MSLPIAGGGGGGGGAGLELVDLKGPFQPKQFYDSAATTSLFHTAAEVGEC